MPSKFLFQQSQQGRDSYGPVEIVEKGILKVSALPRGYSSSEIAHGATTAGLTLKTYTMNKKVPPTASNKRKRESARKGDLVTYKRKKKTIDPSTVVPLNTIDSVNKGVSEGVNILIESAAGMNILQGSEFENESAQAGLGAQPSLPNVCPDFNENIPIFGGYSEGEGTTRNDDLHFVDIITIIVQEKLLIRVHHHQSTWDLRKEPQVVQDFVKLKGLDRIGAISYNYYNSALISTFVERWQPENNSFHFKWGKMTPTLDDVEQLVGLPADGDATVIGGTWGFSAILEVFENNLLQDLNVFKSLKVGGAVNSLSLKKLKEYYAYRLEKVLRDRTAAAAKKNKGLTARSVARAYFIDKRDSPHAFKEVTFFYGALASLDHVQPYYPNKVVRQFNREQGIPTKRLLIVVSNLWTAKVARKFSPKYEWVDCFSSQKWKEFTLKKADRRRRVREGPLLCTEAYLEWFTSVSWTTICPIIVDLAANDSRIHQRKPASVNEHGDTPVYQSEDIAEQYDTSTSECDLLKETIEQMKAEIKLRCVVDEQCVLEFADLPRQLDVKYKEIETLKAVNTILMEQIDMQLPPATPPVLDTTLTKKYEDLLAAHEDVKKKLIAKEDFRQKLVNAEEMMKSLEANNIEW
ncbi:hypothetical protein GIB67_042187, partial [Kingdonia uniflora]